MRYSKESDLLIAMSYFLSHIGAIFFAAIIVAVLAVAWQVFTEKNAELKRQKMQAARKAAEDKANSDKTNNKEQ